MHIRNYCSSKAKMIFVKKWLNVIKYQFLFWYFHQFFQAR